MPKPTTVDLAMSLVPAGDHFTLSEAEVGQYGDPAREWQRRLRDYVLAMKAIDRLVVVAMTTEGLELASIPQEVDE